MKTNIINERYSPPKEYQIYHIENIDEIYKVIDEFDKVFEPSLSERILNLDGYAEKLYHNAIVLVAKKKDYVNGFAAFYANNTNTCVAYLTQIAVKSKVQNQNIGQMLLDSSIEISKKIGMSAMKLEVNDSNHIAIHFYKKNGFKFCGDASGDSKYMIKNYNRGVFHEIHTSN